MNDHSKCVTIQIIFFFKSQVHIQSLHYKCSSLFINKPIKYFITKTQFYGNFKNPMYFNSQYVNLQKPVRLINIFFKIFSENVKTKSPEETTKKPLSSSDSGKYKYSIKQSLIFGFADSVADDDSFGDELTLTKLTRNC